MNRSTPEHPFERPQDNARLRYAIPIGRSWWAIAAGYLGLAALLVLPAPLALVVSVIAVRDIQRSKQAGPVKYGMGRAIFGLTVGGLGTILLVVLLARR